MYMTGNKLRPRTEPMYSGGNRHDFPVTKGYATVSYDEFLVFANEEWKRVNGRSKRIYSLACDEKFGLGVFFMDGYGTKQVIIRSTDDI